MRDIRNVRQNSVYRNTVMPKYRGILLVVRWKMSQKSHKNLLACSRVHITQWSQEKLAVILSITTGCALESIQCITHADRSIAFLHFVTLWPQPLTFWPNINWWARYHEWTIPVQVVIEEVGSNQSAPSHGFLLFTFSSSSSSSLSLPVNHSFSFTPDSKSTYSTNPLHSLPSRTLDCISDFLCSLVFCFSYFSLFLYVLVR